MLRQSMSSQMNEFGRIRLTFLLIGIVVGLISFFAWDRMQRPSSFPQLDAGKYTGALVRSSGSDNNAFVPLIVDLPEKGDGFVLILDGQREGEVTRVLLPQGPHEPRPLVLSLSGGEQVLLVGAKLGSGYEGVARGTKDGKQWEWRLQPVELKDSSASDSALRTYSMQRAKLALIERRISALKAGADQAMYESEELQKVISHGDRLRDSAQRRYANEQARQDELDRSIKEINSKRSELEQQVGIVETIAPSSRVAKAVKQSLDLEGRWLDSVLMGITSQEPTSPEDEAYLERGRKVMQLRGDIAKQRARIDKVLRASDAVFNEPQAAQPADSSVGR
jgi:hypothetical protein